MKTIGILGGVGPETTSKIYHSIIDAFREKGQKKYPSILIYNLPFPFVIEKEAIIEGRNSRKMIPYLIEGAKTLEKGGADFGILPCNTLHKYIDEIRESVKIPFLSILDKTVIQLKLMTIKNVGILATETTVSDKLYDDIFINNGIDFLYPTRAEQDNINRIIVDILNDRENESQKKIIEKVCLSLQDKGVEAILLACTDLQIVMPDICVSIPIIDSTEVLIKASLKEMTMRADQQ